MGSAVTPLIKYQILRIIHTKHVTSSSVGQYHDSAGVHSLLRKRIGRMVFQLGGILSTSGDVDTLLYFIESPSLVTLAPPFWSAVANCVA
jgi:hypothetical protein